MFESESPRRILAIANQKGGVGKTTTAINLATALAMSGLRVLLIDLDPQGNASTGLGIDRRQRGEGTYAMLVEGRTPVSLIQSTAVKNLSIIPADPDLAGAEVELVGLERREYRLRESIAMLDGFDLVIIDCPPSLSLLTLNGLGRRHCRARPPAMRVLRAGRHQPAGSYDRTGQEKTSTRAWSCRASC